jgi:fatty-acyl-CoA synthase
MVQAERLRVVDDEMNDVPCDGETMGEIVMRGTTPKGYFEDEEGTAEAFKGAGFTQVTSGSGRRRLVRLMDRAGTW